MKYIVKFFQPLIIFILFNNLYIHAKENHNFFIITLSNPRSITTALERSFFERGDVEVIHEPWSCLFWTLRGNGSLETKIPDFIASAHDFWDLTQRLLKKSEEGKMLYVKDFAFTTYPMILENKEFLSNKNIKFIFLIREPKALIASYYKMLPTFEDFCVDFKALHEIFLEVWRCQGIKPVVIDAEDLTTKPRETLINLCKQLGIPFTEKMLHWEKGMLDIWKCYSKWHQDAANSDGFNKTIQLEEDPFVKISENDKPKLIKLYECNLSFYHALYKHRQLIFN